MTRLVKEGVISDKKTSDLLSKTIKQKLGRDKVLYTETLIIEDHGILIEAYTKSLGIVEEKDPQYIFRIDNARTCREALQKMKQKDYDIILLDISLPPYPEEDIFSGEDIGVWMHKNLVRVPAILVCTAFLDSERIYNILRNVKPNALISKNNTSHYIIAEAILSILDSKSFFCETVLQYFRAQYSNDFELSNMDRKILYELSIGTKTNELPKSYWFLKRLSKEERNG